MDNHKSSYIIVSEIQTRDPSPAVLNVSASRDNSIINLKMNFLFRITIYKGNIERRELSIKWKRKMTIVFWTIITKPKVSLIYNEL